MKNKLHIFLPVLIVAFALMCFAQTEEYNRLYEFDEEMTHVPAHRIVDFYTGERVEVTINLRRNNNPISLASGTYLPLWGVYDEEADPVYRLMLSTGTVVSATGGVFKFTIIPSQNVFTSGAYKGYVTISKLDGTNVIDRGTVHRQTVNIRKAPQN